MADNVEADAGSGGATLTTAEVTWSGDSAQMPVGSVAIITGGEGSWTAAQIVGGAGAVAAGVQRFTLASDDPAVVDLAAIEVLITSGNALLTTIDADTDAIKTSVELLDNAVDGNYLNVNLNIAGTDVTGGAGAVGATTQRITLASDDPAVVDLAAIEVLITSGNAILTTIDADTSTINTSTATIAGAVSGSEMQVDIVADGAGLATSANQSTMITSLQTIDDIVLAEDSVHSSGDMGVQVLTVRQDDANKLTDADGDYQPLTTSEHGCLNADIQHYYTVDNCDATTDWSALSNDTLNLTTDTDHVRGTASLEFDKVNGAADTVFGAIQKTITSVSFNKMLEEGGGFALWNMKLSSIADVDYLFIRLGTDSTNYNEWRVQDDDLTADVWLNLRAPLNAPSSSTGNGWDSTAVTYVCVGVAFDAQNDTLADILVDNIMINSGMQVSADITAEVSSSVTSPNVRVRGFVGNVPTGAGAVTSGTQRTTLASDDPAVVLLGTIDSDTNTIQGDTTSIDGKITACNTGATVLTNTSILGPGDPTIDSYTDVAIDAVTGNNQELIAAPGADKQIWIYGIDFSMATAGTVSFQDEDDAKKTGVMKIADAGGMTKNPSGNWSMPLWKIATNKAFEADVVTGTINGSLSYAIVDVS